MHRFVFFTLLLLTVFFAAAYAGEIRSAPFIAALKHKTTPMPYDSIFANAGKDTVVYKNQTRPDSIFLNGSASAPGQSYHWELVSGPSALQIITADSLTSWAVGALEGTYRFQLTVNGFVSDTVVAFVRDWQKKGIYPCRAGYDTATKTGGQKIILEPNYKGTYIKPDGTSGTWNEWNFITDTRAYVQTTKKVVLSGGDTLLMAGADSTVRIELGGFGGDQGCPVYVMPYGKPVHLRGVNAFFKIATHDSNVTQHVVVDGTVLRGAGYPYGFIMDNSSAGYTINAPFLGSWIANFTLKGLHSTKTNALKIKKDPIAKLYTQYDKFIERNILITDNWIDSSSVEGMYIGSSAPDGGQTAYGVPIRTESVSIINNLVTNCKWDGIQLSNCRSGNEIKHNLLYKIGTANQPSQRAAILLGGNSTGSVDSNLIINSKGDGIQIFGYDAVPVYSNIIDSIYGGSGDQDGMYQSFLSFVSEPANTPLSVFNYGNLVGRIERNVIRIANNNGRMLPGRTHHNTFIHPTATAANSLIVTNIKGDVPDNNVLVKSFPYTLNSVRLKDTGINISLTQGDTTQTFNTPKAALSWLFMRLKTVSADNTPPVVYAGSDTIIMLPTDSVLLTGSATDADGGSILSYQWTKISGQNSNIIVTPDGAQTLVNGMRAGSYSFEFAATDNGNLTARDTILLTVLPPPNVLPTATAGTDQIITLPANAITLTGSGADSDGTIASIQWTKISGPETYLFQDSTAVQTTVGNLSRGIYQFAFQVIDNRGDSARDTIQITVNAPPVVNAGKDTTITLPANTITLQGNATDADGTITAASWTKISGPVSYHFQDSLNVFTPVDALTEGTYLFALHATDDQQAGASDTVSVTVLPAPNIAPTANAGPDQTITLPANSVTLTGTGADSDGSIVSYSWTKTSGPAQSVITKPNAGTTTVTGLVAGIYTFHLAVTDNKNATASDDIIVTVKAATPVTTTKTINVNIYGGSNPYVNSAWNNWSISTKSVTNLTSAAFKYSDGTISTISAKLTNSSNITDNGSTYGNGMAPAEVLRYTSNHAATRSLTLKGLSTKKKYNIELYASRNVSGSATIFTINGISQTVTTYKNLTSKAVFTNLSVNTSGQLVVTIAKSGSYNSINGFVLTETTTTAAATALHARGDVQEETVSKAPAFDLYPNPATNNIVFTLRNNQKGMVYLNIVSTSGRVVLSKAFSKNQQEIRQPLPLDGLAPGVYFATAQMGSWRETKKLVKK